MLRLGRFRMFESNQCFGTVFKDAELTFSFCIIPFQVNPIEAGAFIMGDGIFLAEVVKKVMLP